jgi:hypothetical protein
MDNVEALLNGPFTRAMAREAGLTDRMLQGQRFVRVLPRVWRDRDHVMSDADWRVAAALALPERAHLTGISRLQAAGLDYGPRFPIRCVVQGDLHLAFDNIFLHRTKLLPPLDEVGVTIEAAFVAYCAMARARDGIKVGDWLLHRGLLDLDAMTRLAQQQVWRPGANEALWLVDHLDARCRSLKESETKAVVRFAGLPEPQVNLDVDVGRDARVIGDLVYPEFDQLLVEYEGLQHQENRAQYRRDLDRYELLRDHERRYVQVTHEHLASPRIAVGRVYRALLKAGYEGPPPRFGDQWRLLFLPIAVRVGPRDYGKAAG